jgi:hypothetical protein
MKKNPKGQIRRKVAVRITANRIAPCVGDIVLAVPNDATDKEIQEALEGSSETLPQPFGWLWEDAWWLNAETEIDAEVDPELIGDAPPNDDAVATLVRDEDGDLVLEEMPEE